MKDQDEGVTVLRKLYRSGGSIVTSWPQTLQDAVGVSEGEYVRFETRDGQVVVYGVEIQEKDNE